MSEPTPVPAAPAPQPATSSANTFAVTAFILGIVAVVLALIPVIGVFIVWIPSLVGIGFGIAALIKQTRKKVFTWLGIVLALISGVIAIASSIAAVAVVSNVAQQLPESTQSAQGHEVVYEVTGDGAADISYSTFNSDSMGSDEVKSAALPWTKSFTLEADNPIAELNMYALSAIGSDATTTLSCKITVDGAVVAEQTASGAFSAVSCLQAPQ
ncbi:MAG: MmpS family transport accessory protein [Agromyces sp.]